ncbi:MAG: 16S rRNA (cytosine(1402)-N(4))-methyltransferase RsmH [Patescibacteria group bacterium]|nr:16S rRNA (cytosine(1402)-N(4))-methyltransferase RsmH [Patescibacteria group bacterium]
MKHKPVLLREVIEFLDPKPGEFFIDGTLDGGGHAAAVLEKIMPGGKFLGIDWDKDVIAKRKVQMANRKNVILVSDNYKNVPMILKNKKLGKADGLLLDLGLSSEQLESSEKGFSFQRDEKLDMRYSEESKPVYKWLEKLKESELAKIIKDFGEERFAYRIARAIKKNLPIRTSKVLADIISGVVPKSYAHARIHPATRTFQALRIFVNQELKNLETVLNCIPEILNPHGRAVVISFHSLEDRIVKHSFRDLSKEGKAEILTKKPIVPSKEEVLDNPRSRSAKLRAIKIL